jgi:type II secretory pathway component PulC
MDGYRCVKVAPNSAFARAGLSDGDLIRSIDGVRLEDPLTALEKLGRLSMPGAKRVSIVFEHSGREFTYNTESENKSRSNPIPHSQVDQ